ncbi:MAG: sugar phosphate isomerase/epimerase family protein [Acidobacteriota bacterium]
MTSEMERREFLKMSTAGLAVAGVVGGLGCGLTAAGNKEFKNALGFGMIEGEDLSVMDKFKLAREVGFDGIEMPGPNDLDDTEVLAAQDATGLEIHSIMNMGHWRNPFSSPDPAVREAGMTGMKGAMDKAKVYGATVVLLVPGVVNKDVSYSFAYQQSQEEIRKLIPYAEETGIKIGLENVWNNFLLSPLEMARYIDEFENPMIGAYFDCGNVARFGWPVHWIEALGKRIFKVHVKAYSREVQNEKGPWAGFDIKMGDEGDVDWPSVVKALVAVGYVDWVTSEVSGGGKERLADVKARMDNILTMPEEA